MVTLILEVVFRAFTYGVHATFITLLFPSENFGFLYGVSFLIGGLTGFLAIPLFDMSMGTLSGINSKPLVNPDAGQSCQGGRSPYEEVIDLFRIIPKEILMLSMSFSWFYLASGTIFELFLTDDVIDLDTSK